MTKSPTDKARAVVSDLMRQLDELETKALTLSQEQATISYRAHVENEPAAKKRLVAIKAELASIGADMTSLRSAVDEADRRVIEAREVERGEADKARAAQARKLGGEVKDLCKQIDTLGRDYFLAFIQLRNTMKAHRPGRLVTSRPALANANPGRFAMTNDRHSTSRRSFVLTVDTDMFEPELDEGCTVIIDPDRAFTVGSLVTVATSRSSRVLHGEGHRRYAWASSETDGTKVATVSGNRSSH